MPQMRSWKRRLSRLDPSYQDAVEARKKRHYYSHGSEEYHCWNVLVDVEEREGCHSRLRSSERPNHEDRPEGRGRLAAPSAYTAREDVPVFRLHQREGTTR